MTLYQAFLDEAIALLKNRLYLQPYPIPEGFELKQATVGKGKNQEEIVTTSYAFCSPKLRQIHAAHVQGGSSLQVLNLVIFPHLNYDWPFLGADLVTLPGGHLIALDVQPLFGGDADYQAQYTRSIAQFLQVHQPHLPWAGDLPSFSAAFFPSRRCCGVAPRKRKFWRLRFSQHSKTISLLMWRRSIAPHP